MTLEVSVNLSVLRVLAGRMEVKKCRTSLVQVLELLQREGRVSCGNNPGVKWKVHLCSAALGKDFVPEDRNQQEWPGKPHCSCSTSLREQLLIPPVLYSSSSLVLTRHSQQLFLPRRKKP